MTGHKALPTEVLGSRKSVRRNKIPLPAKYDVLLQLFGKSYWYSCNCVSPCPPGALLFCPEAYAQCTFVIGNFCCPLGKQFLVWVQTLLTKGLNIILY